MSTTQTQFWTPTLAAIVAAAIAERLPVPETLLLAEPVVGGTAPWPPLAKAAILARLTGPAEAELVIVIDSELVDFLKNSPLGALELLPALAPAVAAAATAVGAAAGPLQEIPAIAPDDKAGTFPPISVALAVDGNHRATVWLRGAEKVASRVTQPVASRAGLDMLRDVEMEVTVEIGRTRMTVRELLELSPGQVVELDRAAGSPADLLVNGTLLARGEIVVVDEDFGIRITEIVSSDQVDLAEGIL
ncbi:flagellar motor switch protein FliN [mine drainage metagenome]|uniref:Flagellar motor switch protein FliN n=1 Tax=mine drainage metagenome TaxID=410659 RepID=A0A1J5QPL3_9ZZZZ